MKRVLTDIKQGSGALQRRVAQLEGVREGSLEALTFRQNDPPYTAGSGAR